MTKKPNTAPTATDLRAHGRVRVGHAGVLFGTDPDGDALTYGVVTQPEHGKLTGTAPTLTYTPDDGLQRSGLVHLPRERRHRELGDRHRQADGGTAALHPATPKREFTANVDQRHADGPVRTPKLTTKKPGELLLAFVAADGSTTRRAVGHRRQAAAA